MNGFQQIPQDARRVLASESRIYKTKIEIFYYTQESNYIYLKKSSVTPNHFLHKHVLCLIRIYCMKNAYI